VFSFPKTSVLQNKKGLRRIKSVFSSQKWPWIQVSGEQKSPRGTKISPGEKLLPCPPTSRAYAIKRHSELQQRAVSALTCSVTMKYYTVVLRQQKNVYMCGFIKMCSFCFFCAFLLIFHITTLQLLLLGAQ